MTALEAGSFGRQARGGIRRAPPWRGLRRAIPGPRAVGRCAGDQQQKDQKPALSGSPRHH
jgi:hypothetical protein